MPDSVLAKREPVVFASLHEVYVNLKQNEAQSVRAESTHKAVN